MTIKEHAVPAAIGAAATLVAGFIVGSALGTFERGAQAADEDLILDVIARETVSEDDIRRLLAESQTIDINGRTLTYGQALSLINNNVVEVKSEQKHLKEALEALTE